MTVALYGEGPLDVGDRQPFADADDARVGPLVPLLERTLGSPDGLVFETLVLRHVKPAQAFGEPDLARGGLQRKARLAAMVSKSAGRDAVVIVLDEDGRHERLDELERGAGSVADFPYAVGVARPAVEAWLLGDRAGWARAFGTAPAQLPSSPETETGGRRSERYAKGVVHACLEEVDAARFGAGHVEQYTYLARHLDPARVERSCPVSFRPFAAKLRRWIAPLFGGA